jgi:GNAT superfamily N-acetyltransferase
VAQVARALAGTPDLALVHEDRLTPEWLVGNDRALANYPAVEASLRLPDAVFASVHEGGHQVARARANLAGDWALLGDLTVQPDHRRRGLARVVMADLVAWAAERGAGTMLLQVVGDNAPAQALYAGLGFARHHSYRYLVPPVPRAG